MRSGNWNNFSGVTALLCHDRNEESLLSRPFKRDEATDEERKLASLLKIQNAGEFPWE